MSIKIVITDTARDGSGFMSLSDEGEEVPIGWLRQSTCEEYGPSHGDFAQAPDLKEPDAINQTLIEALRLTPLTVYIEDASEELKALINDTKARQNVMIEWAVDYRDWNQDTHKVGMVCVRDSERAYGRDTFEKADDTSKDISIGDSLDASRYFQVPVSFNRDALIGDIITELVGKFPQVPYLIIKELQGKLN